MSHDWHGQELLIFADFLEVVFNQVCARFHKRRAHLPEEGLLGKLKVCKGQSSEQIRQESKQHGKSCSSEIPKKRYENENLCQPGIIAALLLNDLHEDLVEDVKVAVTLLDHPALDVLLALLIVWIVRALDDVRVDCVLTSETWSETPKLEICTNFVCLLVEALDLFSIEYRSVTCVLAHLSRTESSLRDMRR